MKTIKKIINIGYVDTYSLLDNKRIRIVNFAALLTIIIAVSFLIIDFIVLHEYTLLRFVTFTVAILFSIITIYLQYIARLILARVVFLLLILVVIFVNANIAFKGFYGEYEYLALPLLAILFFDKSIVHYNVLIFSIILFYVPNYFLDIYDDSSFGYLNTLFLFIAIFAFTLFFKNLNQKNEGLLTVANEKLEKSKESEIAYLQLKSLKSQMNPHFMFNAMNSIQNLVLKGDKEEAYDYLTKFSSLIRENLNMSEKSFVYFEEELSLLKKYLELEKLRFREDFKYQLIGMETIEDIKIPSMIIQPFVENAIKHGLLHKTDGHKSVTIEFFQEDVFKCIITDNGIGIEASKKINTLNNNKQYSFSTKAIKDRLELLRGYYKLDIGFDYKSIKKGTQVILKIPYKFDE